MKVYIASDHRGFNLKTLLVEFMKTQSYEVEDLGNDRYDHEDDYPDFAAKVAEKVSAEPGSRGIVICGSGAGVDIVANKFDGVRSVLAISPEQAKMTKTDDDTNVLAIAADFMSAETAREVAEKWLNAEYSGEPRHQRRLDKVIKIEGEQ